MTSVVNSAAPVEAAPSPSNVTRQLAEEGGLEVSVSCHVKAPWPKATYGKKFIWATVPEGKSTVAEEAREQEALAGS